MTPSTLQILLEAMLRMCAWLVSNVASMFRTIFNRRPFDWRTDAAEEGLLPTSSDIPERNNTGPPDSRSAVDAHVEDARSATPPSHSCFETIAITRRSPKDELSGCGRREALILAEGRLARMTITRAA